MKKRQLLRRLLAGAIASFAGLAAAPALAKLQGAFVKALHAPAVQQKLSDMGYQVVGNTPAQFRKIVQDSSQRYGELLSTGAVKLQ